MLCINMNFYHMHDVSTSMFQKRGFQLHVAEALRSRVLYETMLWSNHFIIYLFIFPSSL